MKGKDLILFAGIGVAAYFLLKGQSTVSADTNAATGSGSNSIVGNGSSASEVATAARINAPVIVANPNKNITIADLNAFNSSQNLLSVDFNSSGQIINANQVANSGSLANPSNLNTFLLQNMNDVNPYTNPNATAQEKYQYSHGNLIGFKG